MRSFPVVPFRVRRAAFLLAAAAVLAACASRPVADAAPAVEDRAAAAADAQAIDPARAANTAAADPAQPPSPATAGAAATAAERAAASPPATGGQTPAAQQPPVADPASTPTEAELDYAAIYGEPPYNPVADPTLPDPAQLPAVYDPWEKFNRRVHAFNNVVDRTVARPLARGYVAVVPRPVRLGVGNFFSNLGQPLTALNALLQGKPGRSGQALARFLINSTLGIAGIFDPASDAGLPRRQEDFGQTLGVWGWSNSRYVELPLFGPRTVRDVFGLAGDMPLSPIRQIEEDKVRFGLQGLQLVDIRAQLLSVDSLREGAVDEYALTRDSWLQRRNFQIHEGQRPAAEDDSLPDYLLEEEHNPTVPVDAIPVTIPQGG